MIKDSDYYTFKQKIVFELIGKDINRAIELRDSFLNKIEKNKSISNSEFKEFLSLFSEKSSLTGQPFNATLVHESIAYFTSKNLKRHYYFFKSSEQIYTINGRDFKFRFEYDLPDLIQNIFWQINTIPIEPQIKTEDVVIKCYLEIENYLNRCFKSKKEHEFFTHYKRVVISAYITSVSGWKFSKHKQKFQQEYAPEDWFQLAEHYLLKIPIDKIRFHPNNKKPRSKK